MIRLAALFAVAAVACVGVAIAPPVTQEPVAAPPVTQEPVAAPHAITVLCVGSMTEERAQAILDGVPADLWTFAFGDAVEGVTWAHGRDHIPTQPGQGALPVPMGDHALCLAVRADYTEPGSNNGVSMTGAGSAGVYDPGDAGYASALVVHELLHLEPGVTVLHTDAELDADAGYRAWLADHPTPGDTMTRGNAWGVWQARKARA